jgi:hypothetical protein
MSFAHPLALLLLLLLIPVVLLYWLRLRAPRVVVGTGLFWQQALAEEPLRARWQRWRTPVSQVLHLLTVVLLALAAAGPAIPPPQRIVLILDNSATMRATDVQPSRFDAAKEAARRMIESLRWCDEMAVVTTSPNPVEIQTPTSDQALLRAAVSSARAQDEPPAIDLAVKLAQEIGPGEKSLPPIGPNSGIILQPGQLPRETSPSRVMLITDGCSQSAARNAQKSGVEVLRVGTATGNQAITCFTSRRCKTDPGRCEVFVEVKNHDDRTAQGKLELSIDEKLNQSIPFAIENNGRWQHLFELRLPSAERLTARRTPEDAYPFDDAAQLHIPADQANEVVGHPLMGDVQAVDIRVAADIGSEASRFQLVSPSPPYWVVLGLAAAILLILEWCLYQRRWTS